MFPTSLRATAQGLCFAIVRICLGAIGWLWAPRNEGKALEQLEAERAAA